MNIGLTCRLINEIGKNQIKLTNLDQNQIAVELDKYINHLVKYFIKYFRIYKI